MAGLADRLLALHELHVKGLLSAEEFRRVKARVIAEHQDTAAAARTVPAPQAQPEPPTPARLHPVVPGVGLALGAAAGAAGGYGG